MTSTKKKSTKIRGIFNIWSSTESSGGGLGFQEWNPVKSVLWTLQTQILTAVRPTMSRRGSHPHIGRFQQFRGWTAYPENHEISECDRYIFSLAHKHVISMSKHVPTVCGRGAAPGRYLLLDPWAQKVCEGVADCQRRPPPKDHQKFLYKSMVCERYPMFWKCQKCCFRVTCAF